MREDENEQYEEYVKMGEVDSGCKSCDKINLSNAVNGILQLVSCSNSEPDTVEEAIELLEKEIDHRTEE